MVHGRFLLLLTCLSVACTKDRDLPSAPSVPGGVPIAPGVLKINEYVTTGSANVNEFGVTADWFEIHNTTNAELLLEAGKWFVTDGGPAEPTKYELPEVTIPARGFLVIWCDNQNTVQQQVHTNFALSSAGEHLLIHYADGSQAFTVDDYAYPAQPIAAVSFGRFPDGEDNWIQFQTPTPGEANQ